MFEKLSVFINTLLLMLEYPAERPKRAGVSRAHFMAWAIETALGFLIFVVIFGQVAYPLYLGVSTSGWDTYTVLLWGFLGLVAVAAFLIRVIDSAKRGFEPLI